MSLIKDVRSDLAALNRQPSEVRKFGTTMAAAFGLFLGLGIWKEWSDGLLIGLASVSIFFGAGAYLFQRALIPIRIGWMGVAFCLGWIVSRVILIVLFYGVVTPIALLARIAGKKFLPGFKDRTSQTYWVVRDAAAASSYKKMH